MTITQILKDFKRRRELKKVSNHAIKREYYNDRGILREIQTPKEIRQAYFELFERLAKKGSIQHNLSKRNLTEIDNKKIISFYGRAPKSSNLDLKYWPNKIELEISSYSFNGCKYDVGIKEIGLFSTSLAGKDGLKTNLRVGDTFEYNRGYRANHIISKALEEIQNSNIIPYVSGDQIYDLPGITQNKKLFREK